MQSVPGGVRLLVEASAGAKTERFPDGFNPWRGGRIGVRVRAPAQEGKANEAIVRLVAAFFDLSFAAVRVEAGHLDSRKTIAVAGITRDAACALLAPHPEA